MHDFLLSVKCGFLSSVVCMRNDLYGVVDFWTFEVKHNEFDYSCSLQVLLNARVHKHFRGISIITGEAYIAARFLACLKFISQWIVVRACVLYLCTCIERIGWFLQFPNWFLSTFCVMVLIIALLLYNQAGLALGDLKSVKDLYDFKTLSMLFLIGSIIIFPTLLKRKRIYEWRFSYGGLSFWGSEGRSHDL